MICACAGLQAAGPLPAPQPMQALSGHLPASNFPALPTELAALPDIKLEPVRQVMQS